MKNLGQELKALREAHALTQKELAAKIYAGYCSYATYEQGLRFMPADLLANVADVYGVSMDWLLGRTDDDGRGKLWTINRQFALAPLGQKLKSLREERGLTQKELAAKINVGKCTYCAYEKGNFLIPTLALVKVADVYGVSVDWLLGRTEDDGRGKLWTRSGKIVADDGGSESAPTVRPLKDGRVPEKVREVHENARETPQAPTESRGHARESSGVLKFSPTKLKAIMVERFLTQGKVASLSDLSLYTVNRILRGKTTPTLRTISKLAKGLGVGIIELCERVKDERSWFERVMAKYAD